jgi:hypothetical protein
VYDPVLTAAIKAAQPAANATRSAPSMIGGSP